jgi:hypothetical protein
MKHKEALIEASKEVGLEVNAGKTMLMSCHQNAAQNYNMKTAIRSFENLAKFKYLGTTVKNQNRIYKEIKKRLNLGTVCYHSV